MTAKTTVGRQYLDNITKNTNEILIPVMELAAAQQEGHDRELVFAVEHAQKKVPCERPCTNDCKEHILKVSNCYKMPCFESCKTRPPWIDDLFIEYQVKQEPLMPRMHRFYFIPHVQCPSPNFDQTLFFYDHKKENISYLWTVPDKEASYMILQNSKKIVPEERQLLHMVISYFNGTLDKLAKRFNGEKEDSIILEGN